MAKKTLLFIFTSLIGVCVFFSCTKIDSEENPPVIEFISLDMVNPLRSGDIIYTDSLYLLKSIMKDDGELSSYSVKIWSAIIEDETNTSALKSLVVNLPEGASDSAIFNKAFQDTNIFGVRDTSVTTFTSFKIDSAKTVNGVQYPILLGDHYLKLTVVDVFGNETRDSILVNVQKR